MKSFCLLHFILLFLVAHAIPQVNNSHNLSFSTLPQRWDEGIPLGNGKLGALVWQNNGMLRVSIDRADLWDLRPTKEIQKYTYEWAYRQKLNGQWDTVWKVANEPYDQEPAPTKLPGAAIEFDISNLGSIESVILNIQSAICTIRWETGVIFRICIDAQQQVGRYHWKGMKLLPTLKEPNYVIGDSDEGANEVVDGQDLRKLGYKKGKRIHKKNQLISVQDCWGALKYEAAVAWKPSAGEVNGAFSISTHYRDKPKSLRASKITRQACRIHFDEAIAAHKQWWRNFWEKSSVTLPDIQLEKQWYLEMYKFGSELCKAGHGKLTCPLFTSNANFAFTSGIQEMLLQSHNGYIEVFPAIPPDWKNVSFKTLRADGAFLVSARKENGVIYSVTISSEKQGTTLLKLPFRTHVIRNLSGATVVPGKEFLEIHFTGPGFIEIENGFE